MYIVHNMYLVYVIEAEEPMKSQIFTGFLPPYNFPQGMFFWKT